IHQSPFGCGWLGFVVAAVARRWLPVRRRASARPGADGATSPPDAWGQVWSPTLRGHSTAAPDGLSKGTLV
ncbi:MAG: hypothetical protein ACR2F6_07035, partial [Mycobacteriales bacterium]